MSENSTSDVGRAAIEAYLSSVEQALLTAHAPRSDRGQVLQDLESQIADMLAQQPEPLTEATVHAVIEKLEPPSHFAAMYGNGKQPQVARTSRTAAWRGFRWSYVAAGCFGTIVFGIFLELAYLTMLQFVKMSPSTEFADLFPVIMLGSLAFGYVATPCALALAYRQLRAEPSGVPDRDLVLKIMTAYAIVAPGFLIAVITEWTYGLVLIPFGVAVVVYLQYKLVQRLRRYVADALPPQSANAAPSDAGPREAMAPIGSTMAMSAM